MRRRPFRHKRRFLWLAALAAGILLAFCLPPPVMVGVLALAVVVLCLIRF